MITTEPTTDSENRPYPPCKLACPILTDARDYVQFIAERKFEDAFAAIRRQNPLPGVCGRICTHPCEAACKRGDVDEPIAIARLKRVPSDGPWRDQGQIALPRASTGFKVAVIGSGPAGLSAAHDLALMGHKVTIFEALPVLGGMLRVGVPAYRLPKEVLDREIQMILDLGIEVRTGVRIGEQVSPAGLLKDDYNAVFVAIGAHQDRKLGISGEEDLEGVVAAVSFLGDVNAGKRPDIGNKAAVIGGGNTAIDSARSARRLGVEEVHILYRRSHDEMPAAEQEVEEAVDEGVRISYLTSAQEIVGNYGRVSGLKCIRNELGPSDAGGRRSPRPVPGTEFTLEVDTVIAAVGQAPAASFLGKEVETSRRGNRILTRDPNTPATSHPGIFAGGDAVTGPATAVEAIAAGKRAARAIDAYLRGNSESVLESAQKAERQKMSTPVIEQTKRFQRCRAPGLAVDERLGGFDEVVSVLSDEQAVDEALRCLHCCLGAMVNQEKCVSCLTCVRVCPLGVPRAGKMGEITINPVDCQACGICAVECPVRAIDINLHSQDDLIVRMEKAMDGALAGDPVLMGFFDLHGNFTAKDLEHLKAKRPNMAPVTVFGLRRLSTYSILKAFELGADGILLAACPPERDPFPAATVKVKERMAHAAAMLEALGMEKDRLEVCHMPTSGLMDEIRLDEWVKKIKEIGPSPLRV